MKNLKLKLHFGLPFLVILQLVCIALFCRLYLSDPSTGNYMMRKAGWSRLAGLAVVLLLQIATGLYEVAAEKTNQLIVVLHRRKI